MPESGDTVARRGFGDVQLHPDCNPDDPPVSDSQRRSNSGVSFFDRCEIQVLDCFEGKTYAGGVAGGIYGQLRNIWVRELDCSNQRE